MRSIQDPKWCRLCRPQSEAMCHHPLCPFYSLSQFELIAKLFGNKRVNGGLKKFTHHCVFEGAKPWKTFHTVDFVPENVHKFVASFPHQSEHMCTRWKLSIQVRIQALNRQDGRHQIRCYCTSMTGDQIAEWRVGTQTGDPSLGGQSA